MDKLTLLRQQNRYSKDIMVFQKMVIYKTEMQQQMHLLFDDQDRYKLQNDIPNRALIQKMVVIADKYQEKVGVDEVTRYALTKSAAVILSELDLPEFKTFDGHLSFYETFLAYTINAEDYKTFTLKSLIYKAQKRDV